MRKINIAAVGKRTLPHQSRAGGVNMADLLPIATRNSRSYQLLWMGFAFSFPT
jgi:hypothetical protein